MYREAMSVICLRDTNCGVTNREGVAYRLWERIDRALYDRKLTQKWLVEHSGVSAMTINRLKTQTRPPKAETVHALADALDIDREEAGILAGRLRPAGTESPSVQDAIRASDDLTDSNKDILIELYEQLTVANTARIASSERRTPPRAGRSGDAHEAM